MFPPRLSSERHCVENTMLLHIEIFCRISIKMPGLQDFGIDNLSFTFYSLNGHGDIQVICFTVFISEQFVSIEEIVCCT